jgi:hypothetical protein
LPQKKKPETGNNSGIFSRTGEELYKIFFYDFQFSSVIPAFPGEELEARRKLRLPNPERVANYEEENNHEN